jgi:molybdenum cofactor cytidylyltransferase
MTAEPVIAGLILAAGESSRMGQDKALLLYRGRTFLETIIRSLREAAVARIVVVLGHHAEQIHQAVNLGTAEVVINHVYRQGQTSSLQTGLHKVVGSGVDAVLLCLVDHPAVEPETLRRLIRSFQATRKPLVLPTFGGERGHPVLIGRELFQKLVTLRPQERANAAIRKHRGQTEFVEVTDPGVLVDVDNMETYRQLTERG